MAEPAEKPRGQTITVTQAAALLNRTPRWVQNLVAAGFIQKSKRGSYSVVEVVRGAVAYYEDQLERTNKSAAASRATDARTREIELRIAERRRELIPVEEAKAVVMEYAQIVRAELSGLPARFTRDVAERRKLEQELDGSFGRIAAACERAAAAVGEPGGAVEAEPEA
jgi:restriction endonuclease Mrr